MTIEEARQHLRREPRHALRRLTHYIDNPNFPDSDFWARFFVSFVMEQAYTNRFFENQDVTEIGLGNGRMIISFVKMGARPNSVTGLEVDPKIIPAARFNLAQELDHRNIQYRIIETDAVQYFHDRLVAIEAGNQSLISGRGIMCLPQSFHPENDLADGYRLTPLLKPFAKKYGKYALALNAAVLDYAFKTTDADFQMLLILSGRVDWRNREKIITDAGWEIVDRVKSIPIQQDYNTNIEYVRAYDDGKRFWEKFINEKGEADYRNISAEVAVQRQVEIRKKIQNGEAVDIEEDFNVYIELMAYRVKKPNVVNSAA